MKKALPVIILVCILISNPGCGCLEWNKITQEKPKQPFIQHSKEIDTSSPAPTIKPPSSPATTKTETVLLQIENKGGCQFTNIINFQLAQDSHITKWRTWYSWNQDESTIPYTMKKDGQVLYQGQLTRQDCDPYQKQWCQASDLNFAKDLAKGNYEINVTNQKICQNAASQNQGYITLMGYAI